MTLNQCTLRVDRWPGLFAAVHLVGLKKMTVTSWKLNKTSKNYVLKLMICFKTKFDFFSLFEEHFVFFTRFFFLQNNRPKLQTIHFPLTYFLLQLSEIITWVSIFCLQH